MKLFYILNMILLCLFIGTARGPEVIKTSKKRIQSESVREQQKEIVEIEVFVTKNINNKFVVVRNTESKKTLWIKNIELIESRYYLIKVEVYQAKSGGFIYGRVISFSEVETKETNF